MTKKKKIIIGIGVLAFLGALTFLYDHIMYVNTDDAQVEAHSVMLSPKVAGLIVAVNVNEGQTVKKGDVLVEIDGRDYQNTLTQVKGDLTSIEARRRDAERNYQRINQLFASGAVSRAQFDTATATYSDTKAKYDAIAAQVAQAQLNLDNTKIRAPSDGFIAKRSAEIGQLAGVGVPLIGFVDGGERWVIANFKETQIADIKIGANVKIDVDAISGSFHGKVVSLSSATGATFTLLPPDNATGNFTKVVQRVPVKIEILDLNAGQIEALRAGLSANIKVSKH
ncbi:MAG: HlyD family secretion protein [Bdellovibrionota bacterium]